METSDPNTKPRPNEDIVCDRCGRFGAFDFAGTKLCEECYEVVGSCCPEFGADDLWQAREKD